MSHVFVVRGDLMQLACDAWLVSGGNGGPGHTWRGVLPPKSAWLAREAGWGDRERSILLADVAAPEPLPFLTNISGERDHAPEWYVDSARHFVRVAARTLREKGRAPSFARAKHLLALPLVGTAGGGGGPTSGEIVHALVPALRAEAGEAGVDVALVLKDGPAWAAAHGARSDDDWRELSPRMRDVADALARKARSGDLVAFLGAGVSQGAGLPSWSDLLSELAAARAHLDSDDDRAALKRLGELDRAAVIKKRLEQQGSPDTVDERLGHAVARLLRERGKRHALTHGLLASLPVDEVITTNYDDLFERASLAADRACTVLPSGDVARGQRWLLKMHGCVTRPESIVLTREDYLKFQENRTALAGIVQALLLTRHMLFVGFSFSDDNFHRIAHAVRQAMALAGHGGARFGTTLVIGSNPLAEELWGNDLEWLAFEGPIPEQVRLLEIFLDRLTWRAAGTTAHLGDRRYDGVLTDGERALRDRIEALIAQTPDAEKGTAAWAEVERMMRRLGIQAKVPPA
jgi:hypothetical protein